MKLEDESLLLSSVLPHHCAVYNYVRVMIPQNWDVTEYVMYQETAHSKVHIPLAVFYNGL